MNLRKVSIALSISIGFISLLGYPLLAQINQSNLVSQSPPKPPRTPPDNKTEPGGGLNAIKKSCNSSNSSDGILTALLPEQNPVLTTSPHPTFLFYIPDKAEDIERGEFWINTQDGKKRVYKIVDFTLPKTPGIVSISLPQLPESALEEAEETTAYDEGKYYHWYLKIYCKGNTGSQPDIDLNGWVLRVKNTPERESQIVAGSPDIWYDSLAQHFLSEDTTSKEKREELLKYIERENLAQQPFVGSVIFTEE